MTQLITLISDPATKKLDEAIINKAFTIVEKKHSISNFKYLAQDEACDIELADNEVKPEIVTKLQDFLYQNQVDYIIQNNKNRKKKLLITDMDSTIIEQECIDEIADIIGIKDKVSIITERAMNGELEFQDALRERVALLKDIEINKLNEIYKNQISFMPGARELVTTMRKNKATCVLVSGGFTFFTDKIASELGFNSTSANILEHENGKLTGKVTEPILDKNSKKHKLLQLVDELQINIEDTLSTGDGANDIPMLETAGLGIAFHAKPNVQKQIKHNVIFTSLKSALYAQGYSEDEIVV